MLLCCCLFILCWPLLTGSTVLFGSKVHKFTFFSRATESQSCPSLWAKWRPQKPDHISRVWFGQPMAGRDHNMETQKLNQFGGPTSFSIGQKWRKWVVRKPMACQMSITTRYKRQFYKRWFIPLFIFYINFLYKHQCSITIFFFFLSIKFLDMIYIPGIQVFWIWPRNTLSYQNWIWYRHRNRKWSHRKQPIGPSA